MTGSKTDGEKLPAGALVIGGDHPGLGVARSLGRRGIPVYIVDDQHSIARFSRYVTRVIRVKNLRDEQEIIDAVLDIGERFKLNGWVLYPTRDEIVAAFSRQRARLARQFRVTTPDWGTIQWAWNKKNTYALATRLEIPAPKTWNVRSICELDGLDEHLPLAVKPAVKENFFYATGAKAWRANNPAELREVYSRAAQLISSDEILIQEIIPGNGAHQFSFCAFVCDGEIHSSLVAQRARQHPREFGRAATYVQTTELPEIEELSRRFLKSINFYGLVELEYKQDPRDGQYKLLDVNARTWGFHILGAASGVDFPYLLFADQLGHQVERVRGVSGFSWVRFITDLPTSICQIASGHLSLNSYLDSIRNFHVESVFCKKDPLPSLAELLMLPYFAGRKFFL